MKLSYLLDFKIIMPAFKGDEEKGCYVMEDKFELIEDFQSPKRSKNRLTDTEMVQITFQEENDEDDPIEVTADWRPQFYKASEHPVQLMVWLLFFITPDLINILNRWILTGRIF